MTVERESQQYVLEDGSVVHPRCYAVAAMYRTSDTPFRMGLPPIKCVREGWVGACAWCRGVTEESLA